MTIFEAQRPIESDIFAPIEERGGFCRIQHYPKKVSTITTLNHLLDDLGITLYRLAKLLGYSQRDIIRWTNGERNPSPYYLTLMLELRHLVASKKIDLRLVDSIDWTTGEIFNKAGLHDKGRHGVPSGKRALPEGGSPQRDPLSWFSAQSPG